MDKFFIGLAGVIHVFIFAMESLLWGTTKINRAFNVSAEVAEHNRLFAFNQGFYNLFLAIAALLGIGFSFSKHKEFALTLMGYAAFSMFAASLVLVLSENRLWRPALIQGGFPLVGLIFLALKILC